MIKVVLVIHLIIAAAMIGIVLMQKSEGGALGIGGGGGGAGGFLTGRGTANLLTRVTAGLACLFFVTSITLTILAGGGDRSRSRLNNAPTANTPAVPGDAAQPGSGTAAKPGSLLDRLKKGEGFQRVPSVPQNQ